MLSVIKDQSKQMSPKFYSMDQTILICDEGGQFNGEYIPRGVGHTGQGRHHQAITVLIYNSQGQVLLQKRKHIIFDNVWDFTGATHPLHKEDGSDETYEEATVRCLGREYEIQGVKLENLGFFNYFAQYKDLCENEYCAMMVGEYNGNINLNPEVGYGYKWQDKAEFLTDFYKDPVTFSPWVTAGIKVLLEKGFFGQQFLKNNHDLLTE